MNRHLIWFRNDLRTIDNSALFMACQDPDVQVMALYFITPQQWQQHHVAGCRVEFELNTLRQLSLDLQQLGIPLTVLTTANFDSQITDLATFCQQQQITDVFYNKQYEVNEKHRDMEAEQKLQRQKIDCHAFDDQCVVAPRKILTQDGRFYSVFTPFKKAWLNHTQLYGFKVLPAPTVKTHKLNLQPSNIPHHIAGFTSHIDLSYWPAGEHAALQRLTNFCQSDIDNYKALRDFPASNSTSQLSPYLAIGAISARQCYQAALNRAHSQGYNQGIEHWISELVWREFYKHILIGFDYVSKHKAFKQETDALPWRHDKDDFERWCQGKTGFPLVDAAMRQLNTIGWMHNRLRMVAAMFLTKDLFIDWRWGERYFMEHLIDGDLAANNGGWQWSASTGNDAAPYFRIFNPTRQSEKFDPEGDFIRQYLPELAHLDKHTIHEPYANNQQHLFLDYPPPMVNHRQATQDTVKHFQQLKHN